MFQIRTWELLEQSNYITFILKLRFLHYIFFNFFQCGRIEKMKQKLLASKRRCCLGPTMLAHSPATPPCRWPFLRTPAAWGNCPYWISMTHSWDAMSCPYALAHATCVFLCISVWRWQRPRRSNPNRCEANTTAFGILEQTQQLVDRMCGGNKYINGIICVSRGQESRSYIVI